MHPLGRGVGIPIEEEEHVIAGRGDVQIWGAFQDQVALAVVVENLWGKTQHTKGGKLPTQSYPPKLTPRHMRPHPHRARAHANGKQHT